MADKVLDKMKKTEGVETAGGMLARAICFPQKLLRQKSASTSSSIRETDLSGGRLRIRSKRNLQGPRLQCGDPQFLVDDVLHFGARRFGCGGASLWHRSAVLCKRRGQLAKALAKVEGIAEVDNGLVDASRNCTL